MALRADETAREPGEFSSRVANASTAAPNASAAHTLLTTRIAVIVTKRARGDNSPLRERAVPSLKMSTSAYAARPAASTPALFGRVMGLVAVTVGFATLGVWLGRDSGGATWFISWLLALGCLFGLQFANARGNTGLALVLLFAFGLLIGVSVSMTVNYYSAVDPTAVRQAFAATALFVGVLGSGGYAVRRDLSFLYRFAFFGLLALLLAGIVLIFVHISAAYTIWSLFGLAVFGIYTVADFNRLRHAGSDQAIPLAAGIFLDVLNVFLFFLQIFGRSN